MKAADKDKIACVTLGVVFLLLGLGLFVPTFEKPVRFLCGIFGYIFFGSFLLLILGMVLFPIIKVYMNWDGEKNKGRAIILAFISSILLAIGLLINPFI